MNEPQKTQPKPKAGLPLGAGPCSADNIQDPFPLARVTMPMIRVMHDATLSWAERETVAAAVNACVCAWHLLLEERAASEQKRYAEMENKERTHWMGIQKHGYDPTP